ncbi:MAG: hypothetical protein PVJ57_13605 [Phycisphaerae bacterium]|jgi:hypothetical protein
MPDLRSIMDGTALREARWSGMHVRLDGVTSGSVAGNNHFPHGATRIVMHRTA